MKRMNPPHVTPMLDSLFDTLARDPEPGERAHERVRQLHALDRWSSFDRYRETSLLCAEMLRAAGLAEVERVAFPVDGRARFGDWIMPLAWDVEGATLDLL